MSGVPVSRRRVGRPSDTSPAAPGILQAARRGPLRRILVDGGSGAGKTTLARRLQAEWTRLCGEDVQLVSLDAIYPGWHGLAEASRMVVDEVLRGEDPGYRAWDWERSEPGAWVPLDADRPVIVEGCGAITPASAELADLCLWVELDEPTRRERALSRDDGDAYRPWWDAWAAQERAHWALDQPRSLAHVEVHTAHS